MPDEADAPPEDVEPPFDPGPVPDEIVIDAAPVDAPPVERAAPSRPTPKRGQARSMPTSGAADGIQRYGESVVREVLGATFLEEVEAPGRPGFGERG